MLYMYKMSGFVEKLNIQNYENSTENFEPYICTKCLDLQNNWISRTAKIQCEIIYIIYVRKVWICRNIEYPELRKYNEKLCTLYVYVTSGFAKNLNIQNCENSTGNLVHYICMEWPDLKKNWISKAVKIQREIVDIMYVQNVWISKKIEYPKLCKLIRKLCKLYVRNAWICRKILYSNLRKFSGKLCTL